MILELLNPVEKIMDEIESEEAAKRRAAKEKADAEYEEADAAAKVSMFRVLCKCGCEPASALIATDAISFGLVPHVKYEVPK